jgi:two-component system response regulator ChvI
MKRIRRKFLAVDPGFSEIRNLPRIGYLWRRAD